MKNSFLFIFILFFTIKNMIAVNAYPKLISFTQPDKTVVSIYLKGDEKVHWAETEDGFSLLYNDEGFLVYAIQDQNGNMIPSSRIAANIKSRKKEVDSVLEKIPKHIKYSDSQVEYLHSLWNMLEKKTSTKATTCMTGNVKLLIILMQFTDISFTKTQTQVRNLFNQINYTLGGSNGSVRDYYYENSYKKLTLEFDIVGPYTTQYDMAYYGNRGNFGYQAFAQEAIHAAASDIDYSNYDNDYDGYADGLHILFAGYGEEAGGGVNCIWSHKSQLSTPISHNRTYVSLYSCSPELSGNYGSNLTSIGVICHELGHVFGAPDFYDTDYSSSGGNYEGTGKWDIMASGSWNNEGKTPAHHNPYSKIYIYKWASVTELDSACSVIIKPSYNYSNAFYRYNTTTQNEYFLIENRQKVNFDAQIPGHGMLIYHVHPGISNTNINTRHAQRFYPVCASSSYTIPTNSVYSYGSINSGGCPFPGSRNSTSFTDFSTPASLSWAGNATNKPITNITENVTTGIISFVFNGGSENPGHFTGMPLNSSSIKLNWVPFGNYQVMLVCSENNHFGVPTSNEYQVGQTIEGGGTILYVGSDTSFIHQNLMSENTYYYKLYSKLTPSFNWSIGIPLHVSTLCSAITGLPFKENFKEGLIPSCWSQESSNDSIFWNIDNGIRFTPIEGNYCINGWLPNYDLAGTTVRLISAPFNLSSHPKAHVSFYYQLKKRVNSQDSLTVFYRNSPLSKWEVLKIYSDKAQKWTKDTIILPELSDYYQIAFEAYLRYGNGVAIDDITIFENSEDLDIVPVNKSSSPSIKIYPNPASDIVNITIDNVSLKTTYALYDLMGRKILSNSFSGNGQETFSTKDLKPGSYLIKITSDNFEKTELLIIK